MKKKKRLGTLEIQMLKFTIKVGARLILVQLEVSQEPGSSTLTLGGRTRPRGVRLCGICLGMP